MTDKREEKIYVSDTICEVYTLMEQTTNLLSVLMENYFVLNIDTDERRVEWGIYSYKGVKSLVEAIFDCTFRVYKGLYEIRDKLKEEC